MNRTKRIAFITQDCFIQCDFPVLNAIHKNFEIGWFPYFLKANNPTDGYGPVDAQKYAEELGIHCSTLKLSYRMRQIGAVRQLISHLLEVRRWKPDLLYFNAVGKPYLALLVPFIFDRSRCILAMHDVLPHLDQPDYHENRFYAWLQRLVFPKIHTLSLTQQKVLKQIFRRDSSYAPHPLLDYGPAVRNTSPPPIRFLFFGSLRGNKGIDLLIKAGKRLFEEGYDTFRIIIAGKSAGPEIDQLLKDLPPCFELHLGGVKNEDVASLFENSDYLVLPYRDVTQSGPLMIAYNYDIPAIAPDLDGFREFTNNGGVGILYDQSNPDGLFNALRDATLEDPRVRDARINNLSTWIHNEYSPSAIQRRYCPLFSNHHQER